MSAALIDEAPLFLSVGETAALLGLSDDLVYDLLDRGELPEATFGRRRMVPRQAIDLVVERALAGFDPDRLASAIGSAPVPPGASSIGQARPPTRGHPTVDTGG